MGTAARVIQTLNLLGELDLEGWPALNCLTAPR
jgi:hypothetical protein